MNNWENHLKEAFDMVRMEPELKQSARMAVRQAGAAPAGRQWKRTAVALCMLALLLTGYGGYHFFQPVSIISIDINPSLELGINAFDRVVTVDAYNDDGEILSQSLSLRFLKSADALDAVVSSEMVQACLEKQEALSLTVVGDNEADSEDLLTKLEASVTEIPQVDCHSTSATAVEDAHPSGLSYGKYLAYLEAQEAQPELTTEEVQTMTMKEIRAISGHHSGGHHGSQQQPKPATPTEATQPTTEETAPPTKASHHSAKKKHHGKGHH